MNNKANGKSRLTPLKIGIVSAAIIAGLSVALTSQRAALARLAAENAILSQQTQRLDQLRQENEQLSRLKADADELVRLRREHAELLRLRGEVGKFRSGAETKLDSAERSELTQLRLEKAEAMRAKTASFFKFIGQGCHAYAEGHNGLLPTDFKQIYGQMGPVNWPGHVRLGEDSFEFFDFGKPLNESFGSQILYVRERQSIQLPNGRWSRMYILADGSVQEAQTDDGNFDAWEQNFNQQANASGQQSTPTQ
jgi:hypothetical protein